MHKCPFLVSRVDGSQSHLWSLTAAWGIQTAGKWQLSTCDIRKLPQGLARTSSDSDPFRMRSEGACAHATFWRTIRQPGFQSHCSVKGVHGQKPHQQSVSLYALFYPTKPDLNPKLVSASRNGITFAKMPKVLCIVALVRQRQNRSLRRQHDTF